MKRNLLNFLFIVLVISISRSASAQCTATLTVNTTSSCQDSVITLTASPVGLYDYQWFVNGQLGPLGNEVWNYYAWAPGTYTFEVQITDNNNCTVISNPVTVTIHPNPNLYTPTSNGPVCPGSTLQLFAQADTATSYSWTGPNSFASNVQNATLPNFQAVNAGFYTVVAANNGCNSWPWDIYVDIATTPSVTASVNGTLYNYLNDSNDVCENEFVDLFSTVTGLSNITYSWTGPNNFTASGAEIWSHHVMSADSGIYTLSVTGNTCNNTTVTLTDTALVNVYASPALTVTDNGPVCAGSTLQFTVTGTPGAYDWSGPGGFTSTLQSPSAPNAQPGIYTLQATNGGCEIQYSTNISVLGNSPAVDVWVDSGIVLCPEGGAVMQVMGYTDITNTSMVWSGPNNFTSTNPWEYHFPLTYADSGLYTLTVTGIGCSGPVTLTVPFTIDVRPCVWPGDANNDLVTDNMDVLDLGLAYGTMGPVRPNASYSWQGQYMADWGIMQFCNQDMKFADCNGNGIVTASDTFGISLNYSMTHQKGYHFPQAKVTANPDLYFDLSGITLTPGTTVSIPIKLGTTAIPMVDVYGLAAQVKVDGIIPTSGLTITAPAGWMGSIADALNFTKTISSTQTDWAYVRTDHNNTSGEGTIAMLQFEIPAGTQYQQVQMYFDNVKIIGNTGNVITTVNVLDDTATIYPTNVGEALSAINSLKIVPNPSDAQAAIWLSAIEATKAQVLVTDVTGRSVWSTETIIPKGSKQVELPMSIAPGIYTLQVRDDRGLVSGTLKWVKK